MYDLIIIGAGPGGYLAAAKASKMGKKVAVVENRELGGTCLNRGCVPTKTLLHATELYKEIQKSEHFGIKVDAPTMDFEKMWAHKDETLAQLRKGIAGLLQKSKVDLFNATAKITGANTVTLSTGEALETDKILIATGTIPAVIPIKGVENEGVITSDDILDKNLLGKDSKSMYQSVTVIGGGVIGTEMASVFNNLGAKVTIIEGLDKVLPTLDKEISQNVKMIFKKREIDIITSAKVKEIQKTDDGLTCIYEEKETEKTVTSDAVLISVGRKAASDDLFSDDIRAKLEISRGYIATDDNFATAISNIYAVGDIRGKIQLAHTATAESIHAVCHMFGEKSEQNLELIPSCVYTDPEIACIGMTADEAKEKGIEVETHKYIMSTNAKALLALSERGFIKIVSEKGTDRVLGCQMMCPRATDMIAEVGLAIANNLTTGDIAKLIHPHPTFCEGIGMALDGIH